MCVDGKKKDVEEREALYTHRQPRDREEVVTRADVLDGRSKDCGCGSDDIAVGDVYKSSRSASSHIIEAPSSEFITKKHCLIPDVPETPKPTTHVLWELVTTLLQMRKHHRTYFIAFENGKLNFHEISNGTINIKRRLKCKTP